MAIENLFFEQDRVGKNGVPIKVWKLRTMNGGGKNVSSDCRLSGGFDEFDRTTLFGAVLRHLGIDELPQLINLMRGDLKLVGLRVLPESDVARLPTHIKDYYSTHTPSLVPADLGIGIAGGDLTLRLQHMTEFVLEMERLEKSGGIVASVEKRLLLTRLLVLACINKLRDPVSINLVRLKLRRFLLDHNLAS